MEGKEGILREFSGVWGSGTGTLRPRACRDLGIGGRLGFGGGWDHFLSTGPGSLHSLSHCVFTRALQRQIVTSQFTDDKTEPQEVKSQP